MEISVTQIKKTIIVSTKYDEFNVLKTQNTGRKRRRYYNIIIV